LLSVWTSFCGVPYFVPKQRAIRVPVGKAGMARGQRQWQIPKDAGSETAYLGDAVRACQAPVRALEDGIPRVFPTAQGGPDRNLPPSLKERHPGNPSDARRDNKALRCFPLRAETGIGRRSQQRRRANEEQGQLSPQFGEKLDFKARGESATLGRPLR
jgi:hypothetical protein